MAIDVQPVLFIVSLFVILGIIVARFAEQYKFPRTLPLIFTGVGIGMFNYLLKEPILDVTELGGSLEVIATLVLVVVLFKEGMLLELSTLKLNFKPISLLASLGLILTTILVGLLAGLTIKLSVLLALLFGAILSPTDPAATFALFKGGSRIKKKIESILGGESAFNDAVGIVLVGSVFLPAVETGQLDFSFLIVIEIIWALVGGIIIGVCIGYLGLILIKRVDQKTEISLLTLSSALLAFALSELVGASPVIAAIISGLTLANPKIVRQFPFPYKTDVLELWDNLSFLGEIVAFILLGVFFNPLTALPFLFVALGISFIILLARPLAVYACLHPLRFPRNEKLFIGWCGMRGLTAAVLTAMAFETMIHQSPDLANAILNIVMLVLLTTSIIQGFTMKTVANETGVVEEIDELQELKAKQLALTSILHHIDECYKNREMSRPSYHGLCIGFREELRQISEQLGRIQAERQNRLKLLQIEKEAYNRALSFLEEAKVSGDIQEEICHLISKEYTDRVHELDAMISLLTDRLIPPTKRKLVDKLLTRVRIKSIPETLGQIVEDIKTIDDKLAEQLTELGDSIKEKTEEKETKGEDIEKEGS